MGEQLKQVETFLAKKSAVLPGLVNRQRVKVSAEQKEEIRQKVDDRCQVVLLPVRQGIEEYRERNDIKIASLCEYYKLVDNDNGTVDIDFRCVDRCTVEDLQLKDSSYFADVKILPRWPIDSSTNAILGHYVEAIQKQFKKYLEVDQNVKIVQIEEVKNPTSVDNLIKNVVSAAKIKIDTTTTHRLLSEALPIPRLKILGSGLETRIFMQTVDKSGDLLAYYLEKLDDIAIDASVKRHIYTEMSRLKTLSKSSAEYGNVIDWLDRVLAFPWDIQTADNQDIGVAKVILEDSHFGLDTLKQRIVDIIAVQKYTKKQPPQIICLYGPPGVGKSTIAKSIAEALGRNYYAISLGGAKRSEDITGMKRFFIGAKPGKIIDGITQAGSKNCVLLLDEIDKLSIDKNHGDPAAALLQVLDRNQNHAFKDDYFDIPVDISETFFIATANDLSTIPKPLLNRLEIITLDGYSLNEKVKITQDYLIGKIMVEFGLEQSVISLSPETITAVVEQYTFESGVRQLENIIREITRKHIAYKAVTASSLEPAELSIDDIRKMIEDPYEEDSDTAREGEIGVVNKLSVANGNIGSVSRLEAIVTDSGKGEQIVSDNIVGTALSTFKTVSGLLRYRAEDWQIPKSIFSDCDIYVHSPKHEIRHDGSSGGIADVVCILSAIKNAPVPHDIAFTGAITLKGKVLRIGGVKAKVLAAQRGNMKTIVLPLGNKKDVDKLSADVIDNMEFRYFEDVTEVYDYIFGAPLTLA